VNPETFYAVLESVLSCVCAAMEDVRATDDTYPGCPCIALIVAGEPIISCCDESCDGPGGMLTVSLDNIFPSDSFPDQTSTFEPCKAQTWVESVVVTVARCAPQPDDAGNEPDAVEFAEAARIQAMDAYAVATGLGCCLVQDAVGHKSKRRVQFDSARPLTEEGACVGLEVRAFVEAGTVCGCRQDS